MNKNLNMPVIFIEQLTMESLLSFFGLGNQIVFIIKDDNEFVGGITQGDFKRGLKNGTFEVSEIINTKMCRITLHDGIKESDVENQAKEIFYKYSSINNIPIIDINGKLSFQYEREKDILKHQINHYLNIADEYVVFESFFQCYKNFNIVITGADLESLNKVKNLFEIRYKQIINKGKDIKISINSLSDCALLGTDSIIITLTSFCEVYLKSHNINCKAKIIPLENLEEYRDYNKVYKFSKETIFSYINIFGYEKIILMENNTYTIYIKSLLEFFDVSVEFFNDYKYKSIELKKSSSELILISCKGEYKEEISLGRFIKIIDLLEDYYRVSGTQFIVDNYIVAFNQILKTIRKQGVKILYYKEFNKLDVELKLKLNNNTEVKIVNSSKEKLYNERSVKDWRNDIFGSKIQTIDFIFECIQYSIDNAIYNKLKMFFKNVYRFNTRNLSYESNCYNLTQNRMNYIREGKSMFPENFIEDMYGEKDYPVEEVLNDISGCNIVEINKHYVKYQSNYSSVNFNTDTYGNRITTDIPKEYVNNIYLMGTCLVSGYAVSDRDTLASYLQRKLNENKFLYRVVNLGIDSGFNQYIYQKIAEQNIFFNDIVIMQFSWADTDDIYTFSIDYEKIFSLFKGKRFYWDSVGHCNNKAYELIASNIFENIKQEICKKPEKIVFKLDIKLENEISEYIDRVKCKIEKYSKYKNVSIETNIKSGAIVMNCNPFTYGHKYLIETASRIVDILYIFVVEEDKFIFSFEERFKMIEKGVKEFNNVIVVPGGKFMISTLTFPGYFMKESLTKRFYDSFLDLKIFANYIAPALDISVRFAGTEPFDEVTAQYNKDMHLILVKSGIDVIEIPRKKVEEEVVSASFVRKLIKNGKWEKIKKLVPETTYNILNKNID